jgi:putative ABC transport system permease protein
MFFFTYLRRELRRRMRQAVFIALGLALGIGLVITVMGASAGVRAAQTKVLRSLYGIGTDLTVTTKPQAPKSGSGGQTIQGSPNGPAKVCSGSTCRTVTGGALDSLASNDYGVLSESSVTRIARLRGVAAAVGGLLLLDSHVPLPSAKSTSMPLPTTFTAYGTDITHPGLGPISETRLTKGRNFTTADKHSDVALVDSNYATAHNLKTGGTVRVAGVKFTIIGIVAQPEGSGPPNVYIPLARAQALAIDPGTNKALTGEVNTIYVTAASSADISVVQKEIGQLLPSATVTSASSLASEVTGSLASASKLANELGKWLAICVLIAAFAVASLLTLAAVSRRVQEFGTLKALGWRSRRIVAQVLGESVGTGILGGVAGVGLGLAGVAIINKVAPKLSATVPSAVTGGGNGPQSFSSSGGGGVSHQSLAPATHTVSVPMSASVTLAAIVLAVVLAIAGGLLAGSFGGWRAARLRPAAALTKVA